MEHAPYSLDLTTSDSQHFPNLKNLVAGNRFKSTKDEIAAVDGFSSLLPESYNKAGIYSLEKRWTKYIEFKAEKT